MADKEFVSREEFDNLKEEVDNIKKEINESMKLLQAIDKKIDVIDQKLKSAEEIEALKFNPLQKEIDEIKDNNRWLWRAVGSALIGLAIKIIFDFTSMPR